MWQFALFEIVAGSILEVVIIWQPESGDDKPK
jgi:hypothetical protein